MNNQLSKVCLKITIYIIVVTFLPQNLVRANDSSTLMPDSKEGLIEIVKILGLKTGDGQDPVISWEIFNDPTLLQALVQKLNPSQKDALRAVIAEQADLIPANVMLILSGLLLPNKLNKQVTDIVRVLGNLAVKLLGEKDNDTDKITGFLKEASAKLKDINKSVEDTHLEDFVNNIIDRIMFSTSPVTGTKGIVLKTVAFTGVLLLPLRLLSKEIVTNIALKNNIDDLANAIKSKRSERVLIAMMQLRSLCDAGYVVPVVEELADYNTTTPNGGSSPVTVIDPSLNEKFERIAILIKLMELGKTKFEIVKNFDLILNHIQFLEHRTLIDEFLPTREAKALFYPIRDKIKIMRDKYSELQDIITNALRTGQLSQPSISRAESLFADICDMIEIVYLSYVISKDNFGDIALPNSEDPNKQTKIKELINFSLADIQELLSDIQLRFQKKKITKDRMNVEDFFNRVLDSANEKTGEWIAEGIHLAEEQTKEAKETKIRIDFQPENILVDELLFPYAIGILFDNFYDMRETYGITNIGIHTDNKGDKTIISFDVDGLILDDELLKDDRIKGRQNIFITKGTKLDINLAYGFAFLWYVVKDHGGSITVSNRPEGGQRYEITIPANETSQTQGTSLSEEATDISSPNLAVATRGMYEDNQGDTINIKIKGHLDSDQFIKLSMTGSDLTVTAGTNLPNPLSDTKTEIIRNRIGEILTAMAPEDRTFFREAALFLLPPIHPEYPYYLDAKVKNGTLEYQLAHAGSFGGQGIFIYMTEQLFMDLPVDLLLRIIRREMRLAKKRYNERKSGSVSEKILYETEVSDIINDFNYFYSDLLEQKDRFERIAIPIRLLFHGEQKLDIRIKLHELFSLGYLLSRKTVHDFADPETLQELLAVFDPEFDEINGILNTLRDLSAKKSILQNDLIQIEELFDVFIAKFYNLYERYLTIHKKLNNAALGQILTGSSSDPTLIKDRLLSLFNETKSIIETVFLSLSKSACAKRVISADELIEKSVANIPLKRNREWFRKGLDDKTITKQLRIADIYADANLFPFAIEMILGNMCQMKLEASISKINIRIEKIEDDYVITIEDNGTGFAPEMLLDFSHNGRQNACLLGQTQRKKGTGLGLAFLWYVVKDHGGTLRISNESSLRSGGARFEIHIPLENTAELVDIKNRVKAEDIDTKYPQLAGKIKEAYPDWKQIALRDIQKIVSSGKIPQDWPKLANAMYSDGSINKKDFDAIITFGRIVEDVFYASSLTTEDMALITEAISIRYLLSKAGFSPDFEIDMRRRLISCGYNTEADLIIAIIRCIKRKIDKNPNKRLTSQSDHLFIKRLELLLGYQSEELFHLLGLENGIFNMADEKDAIENKVTAFLSGLFLQNLQQLKIVDAPKEKVQGIIVQDIKDFGPGVKNWLERLRRNGSEVKMGYLIDGLSDEEIAELNSTKPNNVILGKSLDNIKEKAEEEYGIIKDHIVYLAGEERLRPYKDKGFKLVERGNAGPVIELSWCVKMLTAENIQTAYDDFVIELKALGLLEEGTSTNQNGLYYIRLPKVKDEILRMWETLEKGTNYLDMWA